MQRIYAITWILLFISVGNAKKSANLVECYTYKLTGKISNSAKKGLTLSAFSEMGLPVEVKIRPSKKTGLKIIGFRGRYVKASVKIISTEGPRHYSGVISKVEIAAPLHLGSRTKDYFAKLEKKSSCEPIKLKHNNQ